MQCTSLCHSRGTLFVVEFSRDAVYLVMTQPHDSTVCVVSPQRGTVYLVEVITRDAVSCCVLTRYSLYLVSPQHETAVSCYVNSRGVVSCYVNSRGAVSCCVLTRYSAPRCVLNEVQCTSLRS